MRLLVTGGAGFIGSHLVRNIIGGRYPELAGSSVTVLDVLSYAGNMSNLESVAGHPDLRFVQGDICDDQLLGSVAAGQDAIVHLAAESHVDRSISGAGAFVRTNTVGTHAVLAAALEAGVSTVVHVSTDEVYGSIDTGSWTETSVLEPNSPYAASKAGADLLARAYHQTFGLDVRLTRCSNNYGPFQHPEKIIPLFVTRLLDGGHVPLYGDGGNVRDWLHVSDHCEALVLVLLRGRAGEIYNIAGGASLTNTDLTDRLLAATGCGPERVQRVADRRGHDRRYSMDWTKIRDELGYRPAVELADGLAATVRWYADNRGWWEPLRADR